MLPDREPCRDSGRVGGSDTVPNPDGRFDIGSNPGLADRDIRGRPMLTIFPRTPGVSSSPTNSRVCCRPTITTFHACGCEQVPVVLETMLFERSMDRRIDRNQCEISLDRKSQRESKIVCAISFVDGIKYEVYYVSWSFAIHPWTLVDFGTLAVAGGNQRWDH